jgi:hypothetical protein
MRDAATCSRNIGGDIAMPGKRVQFDDDWQAIEADARQSGDPGSRDLARGEVQPQARLSADWDCVR